MAPTERAAAWRELGLEDFGPLASSASPADLAARAAVSRRQRQLLWEDLLPVGAVAGTPKPSVARWFEPLKAALAKRAEGKAL